MYFLKWCRNDQQFSKILLLNVDNNNIDSNNVIMYTFCRGVLYLPLLRNGISSNGMSAG
jgi:hypothetical protein